MAEWFDKKTGSKVDDPGLLSKLEEQWQLTNGPSPYTSLPGLGHAALGIAEVGEQMLTGIVSAPIAAGYGVANAIREGDPFAYSDAFLSVHDALTWKPLSGRGKQYSEWLGNLYKTQVDEKYGQEIIGGMVQNWNENGTPVGWEGARADLPQEFNAAVGSLARIGPEAIAAALGFKSVRNSFKGGKPASAPEGFGPDVNINPLEGEYIPGSRPAPGGGGIGRGDLYEGQTNPGPGIEMQRKLTGPEAQGSSQTLPALTAEVPAPRNVQALSAPRGAVTDLAGDVPVAAQALANRTAALDTQRNTGSSDMTGTMFGQDRVQVDLMDLPGVDLRKVTPIENLVKTREIESVGPSAAEAIPEYLRPTIDKAKTPQDVVALGLRDTYVQDNLHPKRSVLTYTDARKMEFADAYELGARKGIVARHQGQPLSPDATRRMGAEAKGYADGYKAWEVKPIADMPEIGATKELVAATRIASQRPNIRSTFIDADEAALASEFMAQEKQFTELMSVAAEYTPELVYKQSPGLRDDRIQHEAIRAELDYMAKELPDRPPNSGKRVDPVHDDLMTAIRKIGGLNREEAIAQGIDPADMRRFAPGTFTKAGNSFDAARETLAQDLFAGQELTPFVDDVMRASGGDKIYTAAKGHEPEWLGSVSGKPHEIKNAIQKAIRGEVLGKNQAKLVEEAIDHIDRSFFRNPYSGPGGKQGGAINIDVSLRPLVAAVRATLKHGHDLGVLLARNFAMKHVSDIRRLKTPTSYMLADEIMPLENSKVPLKPGYHERVHRLQAQFLGEFEATMGPLRRHAPSLRRMKVVGIPKTVNDELIRGLVTGHGPAKLAPQTRQIRELLDKVYEYEKSVGLKVGYRENYLPIVYHTTKIERAAIMATSFNGQSTGGAFVDFLMKETGMSRIEAMKTQAKILHDDGVIDTDSPMPRLQANDDFAEWARRVAGVQGGPTKAGFEHKRTLDIPHEKLVEAGWVIDDVEALVSRYVFQVAKRGEYARIAGQGEHRLNQQVLRIVNEVKIQGRGDVQPHEVAQSVYDMADALQHKYRYIQSDAARKTVRAINNAEVILHLGMVAVTQIPEFFVPAAMYRVATKTRQGVPVPGKSYVKAILSSLQDSMVAVDRVVTGQQHIPNSALYQHGQRLGLIAISGLESSVAGRFSGLSGVSVDRFLRVNLMEGTVNMMMKVAIDTVNSVVRDNIKMLAQNKGRPAKQAMMRHELIELGVSPADAIEWFNRGMPEGDAFQAQLDSAVYRGSRNTVIEADSAAKPIKFNDPRWSTFLLFKAWSSTFGNTVIKRWFQKMTGPEWTTPRKAASLSSVIAAVTTTYWLEYLRRWMGGYQDKSQSELERWVKAVDRAGYTGPLTHAFAVLTPYKYGYSDTTALRMFNLAGPFVADTARIIDALESGDPKQIAHQLSRLTPILNVVKATREPVAEFYEDVID